MFNIGSFARMGNVSVRSLRHYHEIGLLLPAVIDAATGYRRYCATQLSALNRIVALRGLGFSLDQIGAFLSPVTIDELRGMLVLRRAQIELALGAEQDRLHEIEARLALIEQEDDMPHETFVIRALPAVRVASRGHHIAGFGPDNVEPAVTSTLMPLYEDLVAAGIKVVGAPFIFYDGSTDDATFAAHIAFPVGDAVVNVPDVDIVEFPAVAAAATVLLPAPGETDHHDMYSEISEWVTQFGYEPAGPGRDVFLNVEPPETNEDLVMEIQLPLRRIAANV
jgi:DNA-binding transcriptional MerR regulator